MLYELNTCSIQLKPCNQRTQNRLTHYNLCLVSFLRHDKIKYAIRAFSQNHEVFFFFLTNKQTILDTGENKNMFTETVMGTLVVQLYKPFILAVVPSLD